MTFHDLGHRDDERVRRIKGTSIQEGPRVIVFIVRDYENRFSTHH